VKLISESWDAAGAYTLFKFGKMYDFSEWNGEFRDSVRCFVKGTEGYASKFAKVLCGSKDLGAHEVHHVINFVTCHDGFSLSDLNSYYAKHNLNNGEHNKDGIDDNHSWNYGHEGPTKNHEISKLRIRQMKNFVVALFLSRGVPMINMGDEYGHTKKGNNNTYCQDNTLNWFNWSEIDGNEFFHFFRGCVEFRKKYTFLSDNTFPTDGGVEWHGTTPGAPDWSPQSKLLVFIWKNIPKQEFLLVMFNMYHEAKDIKVPKTITGFSGEKLHKYTWHKLIDTGSNDVYLDCPGVELQNTVHMPPHTTFVCKAFFAL